MKISERAVKRLLRDPVAFGLLVVRHAWGWKEIDPWQISVLRDVSRYIYMNCSRQSGKSTILMVKAIWVAVNIPNALILVVAELRQSNEDLRRVRQLTKAFSDFLKENTEGITLDLITENITSLEFSNGSRIIALPANDKVRGYSAPTMVIIDEAAWAEDIVLISLNPMMAVSNGQLILASTPKGTDNFFYREAKNPRYEQFNITWRDCPRITPDYIARERSIYGEAYVRQEYECRFLEDLSTVFSEKSLEAAMDSEEEVFAEEMDNIQKVLQGEVELI